MQVRKGRAAWLSLFFVFCAALLLLAAALLQGNTYRWSALALLALAYLASPAKALPANWLSLAVAAFCAWLLAVSLFATPAYSAESLYRPLILFAGFTVAASLGREDLGTLFRLGTLLIAALVLLGLLQFYFGFFRLSISSQRAAATFITPNSFATSINLFLLPLVAMAATGRGGRRTMLAALWLYAGLLSTESRGGWVAGLAGLAFIAWYLGLPRTRDQRDRWLRLIAGLLWVYIAFWTMMWLVPLLGFASPKGLAETFGETVLSRGTSLRTAIYEISLGLIADRPIAGFGADMFRFLYEIRKPASMDNGHTYAFVHNDYLQIWLEFGIVGLILLGAIVLSVSRAVVGARRRRRDDPWALACGAAIVGILVHALVDFPLYLPFTLLLLGAWLGALAAHSGGAGLPVAIQRAGDRLKPIFTPIVSGTIAIATLAWLAQPMLAEAAGNRAVSDLLSGSADKALYWQSVARRLEPRNGAHYWIEGVIWRDQAVETRDKAMMAKADMLFAEGMRADPYQIANFLERARTRRKHADLFDGRSEQEILDWTEETLRLRPYSLLAQAERARALDHVGRTDEARRIVREMLDRNPGTDMARGLAKEFGLTAGVKGAR